MSERRLSPEERLTIGQELVAARAAGVDWKILMRQYGLGRTRLWMLWREAKSVHEHIPSGNHGPGTRLLTAA